MNEILKGKIDLVTIPTKSPIETADKIRGILKPISNKKILVDITTFTHENLLITLKLIPLTLINNSIIKFAYANAASYGGEKIEEIWLSKGISEVRSVLGYSGDHFPSMKTHLIILVGYEHERALKLIEVFEPNVISLGCGKLGTETAPKHYVANKYFYDLVDKATNIHSNVNNFNFSCSDPWETKKVILNQVLNYPKHNPIMAPMNTKLSTIGCALAAQENDSIQICYAQASLYNIKNYSKPGDHCYIFDLPEIFK